MGALRGFLKAVRLTHRANGRSILPGSGKRGAVMVRYRAFVMGTTGAVMKRHDFMSTDDAAALEHALQYVDYRDVQVWQLHRRVGLLRHTDQAA